MSTFAPARPLMGSKMDTAARLGVVIGALSLVSAACAGSGNASPVPPGTNVAASTPVPQAAVSGADCENPYVPVVEGATFKRRTTSSLGESTQTATIKDVRSDGFSVERTGVLSSGRAYTYLENWSCTPEGLVQAPTDELAAIATDASGTVSVQARSNEGVTLPRNAQPGDTWTETFNVDVIGPDSTSNWTVTYDFKAIGMEQVTVPAGTFTAIHLTNRITWVNGGLPPMDIDYWFAQGVGLVKSGFTMGELSTGTTDLVSYSIP